MITPKGYWKGRDVEFKSELTPTIKANAKVSIARVNAALTAFESATGKKTGDANSGWRPVAINAATKGAAVKSLHMTGEAIDVADPVGEIAKWFLTAEGQQVLEANQLWMESPLATRGWCHLQTRPPRSGRRVFQP